MEVGPLNYRGLTGGLQGQRVTVALQGTTGTHRLLLVQIPCIINTFDGDLRNIATVLTNILYKLYKALL
jgi:hypothetical protein